MESGGLLCDDALAEILVRLPAVAVLRCRSVCKRWLRIATDPSFLATHAAHRPLEMIIRCEFEPWEVRTLLLSSDRKARRGRRFLCHRQQQGETEDGCWFDVLYSLDGLLVLMQRPGLYIVCNPTTRQWTNLPVLAPEPCSDASVCGFYFHSSSGEYRLLCHGVESASDVGRRKRCCYYYILSAGGALPRRIGRAPDDPIISSSITVDDYVPVVHYATFIEWLYAQAEANRPVKRVAFYELPVAHRGLLHWFSVHPEAARTGKMLAFDTVAETFRLMSRPPERAGDTMRSLLELDGELCVAAMQDLMSLDIWALEGSESWTLRHRVQVPLTCLYRYSATVTKVISIASGIILIGDPGSYVGRLYDLKRKMILCRDLDFGPATPMFLVFSESLVQHAFFDSPRCPDLKSIKFSI